MDQMRDILPGYEVRPLKDFLSLMTSANLPRPENAFVTSMIVLAVAIGFLVIFLSMYTTVIERTRDIGVLKSMGASKGYIIRALLSETGIICAIGIVVGIGMRLSGSELFPLRAAYAFDPDHQGMDYALRVDCYRERGMLGSSYPAWLASRKDVVEIPSIRLGR